jgi:uncharacterized protein (TIGR02246 family)
MSKFADVVKYAAAMTLLAIVLSPMEGHAQGADPVAENRALAAAFESSWNTHDMGEPFRKLLSEDVDWVNVSGGHGSGRETVVQNHIKVHENKFKDSVLTVTSINVALIKPDIAVVHVGWTIRGDRDNDGTPREPRDGLFTWVTVKDGGTWKIRASHNTNKTEVR